MTANDKEREGGIVPRDGGPTRARDDRAPRLPPQVLAALERAKRPEVASTSRPSKGGRLLALVPVIACAVTAGLMLPRAAPPSAIPTPRVDGASLARSAAEDDALARSAEEKRLPGDALVMGTALRAWNRLQTQAASEASIIAARAAIDDARAALGGRADGARDLLVLRGAQLRAFLREVEAFEATGETSADLVELGGGFIERLRAAGWVDGRRVLLDDAQRRTAYKRMWNAVVGVDDLKAFQPTLDEERALYTLYIERPHPAESLRPALESLRKGAHTQAACERADLEERRSTETWRIEKIKRLGAIDPSYPTAYALGTAYYRAGRFDLSIEAFRAWLDAHPDGPYALRAQNHLKAAVRAYGPL